MKIGLFKSRTVRTILVVSSLAIFVVPVIDVTIIYPIFNGLLIDTIEKEGSRITRNLSKMSFGENTVELTYENLPVDFPAMARQLCIENNLNKLKVYSPTGEIVYSSDPEEIGKQHQKPYFYERIAHGEYFTKFIEKESQTLEDEISNRDLVESYFPMMDMDRFLGAFEIYYDVTETKSKFDLVTSYIMVAPFLVSVVLLSFIVFIAQRLEKTQVRLNTLSQAVEQSPNAVLIMNSRGNVEFANPKFTETTGYQAHEIIGKTIYDIYVATPSKYREIWDSIHLGNECYTEFQNQKKNGEKYWVRSSILVIRDYNGVTSHLLAIFEDISRQKNIECALRHTEDAIHMLLNTMSDGTLVIDERGRLVSFNCGLQEMFGYDPEEVEDLAIAKIFSSLDSNNEQPGVFRLDEKTYSLQGQHKNGTAIPLKISFNTITLSGQRLYIGTIIHSRSNTPIIAGT